MACSVPYLRLCADGPPANRAGREFGVFSLRLLLAAKLEKRSFSERGSERWKEHGAYRRRTRPGNYPHMGRSAPFHGELCHIHLGTPMRRGARATRTDRNVGSVSTRESCRRNF